MLTWFTPEHIPVFRALLEIEFELWNTALYLGLYSRLRSNSGTHPRFEGCTQDWDWTSEHILVFRALFEIKIEPVHGRGTLLTSPTTQKNCGKGTSDIQMDIATTRPTRPRGPSWWQSIEHVLKTVNIRYKSNLKSDCKLKLRHESVIKMLCVVINIVIFQWISLVYRAAPGVAVL